MIAQLASAISQDLVIGYSYNYSYSFSSINCCKVNSCRCVSWQWVAKVGISSSDLLYSQLTIQFTIQLLMSAIRSVYSQYRQLLGLYYLLIYPHCHMIITSRRPVGDYSYTVLIIFQVTIFILLSRSISLPDSLTHQPCYLSSIAI